MGVQDASGSDDFAFAARGEWLCQDGVAFMVVQDYEVLATAGRDAVTTVVVMDGSKIPTVDTVGVPGATISGCFVNKDAGSGGC